MYNNKQDHLNPYLQHQQQLWSDQRQNTHDFSGLHPPLPQTRSALGNQRSNQVPIPPVDHHRSLENQHLPYRNAAPTYHTTHPSHMRLPHMQHQQPRPSLVNCPQQHHVIRQHHQAQPPPSVGCRMGPGPQYSQPMETKAPQTKQYMEAVVSSQAKEKMESRELSQELAHTPKRQVSSTFPSQSLTRVGKPLQPVDGNAQSDHKVLQDVCDSKQNVSSDATPASTVPQMKRHQASVMSPISMCFSRMLGAAEMIKTPASKGTAAEVRSKPFKILSSVPEMEVSDEPESESENLGDRPIWKPSTSFKRSSNNESPVRTESDDSNPFDELAADDELERLVVLQMAMQRHQLGGILGLDEEPVSHCPESDCSPKQPSSNIISEGFFWRDYPSCEQVLYKHMEKYYEVSAIHRNYKVQQSFNNILVQEVRAATENSGFSFEVSFDDKKLRDRIRCFYKTHLQNAKKRLATLQKHPDSLENRCLVAVYIRCVRDKNLTFQESLAMAPEFPKKRRRMDKVEKLKLDLAATDAGFASKLKQKRDQVLSASISPSQELQSEFPSLLVSDPLIERDRFRQ